MMRTGQSWIPAFLTQTTLQLQALALQGYGLLRPYRNVAVCHIHEIAGQSQGFNGLQHVAVVSVHLYFTAWHGREDA